MNDVLSSFCFFHLMMKCTMKCSMNSVLVANSHFRHSTDANECALYLVMMIVSAGSTETIHHDNWMKQNKKESACHLHELKSKLIIIIIIVRLSWNTAAIRPVTSYWWGREYISYSLSSCRCDDQNEIPVNVNFRLKMDFLRTSQYYWLQKKLISNSRVSWLMSSAALRKHNLLCASGCCMYNTVPGASCARRLFKYFSMYAARIHTFEW